jgi:hypothetical protein
VGKRFLEIIEARQDLLCVLRVIPDIALRRMFFKFSNVRYFAVEIKVTP